ADLSAGETRRDPEWRVHDRTHLEFAVDYRIGAQSVRDDARAGAGPESVDVEHEWDAYFFVPESLRIHDQTHREEGIYDALQSYVRFAVPHAAFASLAAETARLPRALAGGEDEAIRELRLFACLVRASAGATRRRVLELLADDSPQGRVRVSEAARGLAR